MTSEDTRDSRPVELPDGFDDEVAGIAGQERRQLQWLFLVFFLVLAAFSALKFSFDHMDSNIRQRGDNERARVFVAEELVDGIDRLERGLYKIASADNEAALRRVRRQFDERLVKVNHALEVLQHGGTVERTILLNIIGNDETVRSVRYTPAEAGGAGLAAVEIAPLLSQTVEMAERIAELRRQGWAYQEAGNARAFFELQANLEVLLKHVPSLFERLNENSGRLFYESGIALNQVEKEAQQQHDRLRWIEISGIVALLGCFLLSGRWFLGRMAASGERLSAALGRLHRAAYYDSLTGLPNRLRLSDRLQAAIVRAEASEVALAVLIVEISNFATINTSLGHSVGDQLLLEMTRRFAPLRGDDVLGRWAGAEFLLIQDTVRHRQDAEQAAQLMVDLIERPFLLDGGRELFMTATIGVAIYPEDGSTPAEMIRNAQAANDAAHRLPDGSYRMYSSALNAGAADRLSLESRMHHALDRREFVLHYQPLVSAADQRVVGVESLVRWQDPELGMISPGQFIPVAEENGFIVPLGEWILAEACRQGAEWRAAGLPDIKIAVNLSARQFLKRNLVDLVAQVLQRTGFPAHRLELEITESATMSDPQRAEATITALRALGVMLSLDDFGTGYSSLAYLKRFPVHKLKIDQSFVREIPRNGDDMKIAGTIIGMARNLDLEVLAEGVETEAQRDFLSRSGCDTFQGYLFSKPVPPGRLAEMLRQSPRLLPA